MAKQTIIRFADNELTLLRGSARGKGVQVDLCVREALPEEMCIRDSVHRGRARQRRHFGEQGGRAVRQ